MLLPKETEAKSSNGGSLETSSAQQLDEELLTHDLSAVEVTDVAAVVNSNDILLDDSQQQNAVIPIEDSPKFDQYLLDSLTAAVTSSASATSLGSGFMNYSNANSQTTLGDPHEMPQLLNILNELLDGQDITSLANSGGNGDIVDQEENYDDDSPRKDDPDEIAKVLAQQRLEVISREAQLLQRKMDFLIRRLYKLVARSTGNHVSEEIAGFLEHVARFAKKKEKEKSVSAKFPFLTANLQGTSADLLKPPSFTQEPPLNLLSSPSTQENQPQPPAAANQPLPNTPTAPSTDVIEPTPTDSLKPVPIHEMKSFLRRIENISTMQSTALNKRGTAFKYFTKSSSNNLNQSSALASKSHHIHPHHQETLSGGNNFKVSAIPKFEDVDIEQVEQTSGLLMTELRLIENQIDSDATASSTGGESADEMIGYNNLYQQPLSISKRAAYKYAKDRGAVASRWCWLSTQISELDYKIRQLTDLKKHIRESKGAVTLEAVGFEGQLPGGKSVVYSVESDSDEKGLESSARTRAFLSSPFKKRKLVQVANLHIASKKAARPSTLKCECNWPIQPCALCTGRVDPTQPRECTEVLPESERVALLDPSFHPVLSFPEDVSSTIHLEALCNIPEWQSKMIRSSPKSIMKHATKYLELLESNGRYREEIKQFGIARPYALEGEGKKMKKANIDMLTGKRKYTKRFLKMDSDLANKLKDRKKYKKKNVSLAMGSSGLPRKYTFKKRIPKVDELPHLNLKINGLNGTDKSYDPLHRSKNSSPVPNSKAEKSSESRKARNYDINNIVIPYSVAAATRIELLSYKEIPTPKWKIVTDDEELQQIMLEDENCAASGEVLVEDVSEENMVVIHEKAQMDERKKFETYLKFPLTSRSRANRRVNSRGNESSGANTPTPDATSPAPHQGDIESIPSPLDGPMLNDTPSITAILNNFNGRKDRKRTISKKDEVHDGGGSKSGSASRCISPEIKEIVPAYEPLTFPLTDVSFVRMKKEMPVSSKRQSAANTSGNDEKFFIPLETSANLLHSKQQQHLAAKRAVLARPPEKKRKHNDSITESNLIKEKLPSLTAIGRNNNVLIPRKNNHNILDSIDLTGADGAVLKKLMNNNNGDLINGSDSDENLMDDNSDSETVTGDESLYDPESEETESETEEYLDDVDDVDYEYKVNGTKKKNSSIVDCHY